MTQLTQDDRQSTAFLPSWFRQNLPDVSQMKYIKDLLKDQALHTVCEHAQCPNMGQCWGSGVATLMILGGQCTRGCRFCAVTTGEGAPVDPQEPHHLAEMVQQLQLRYVVITSVTRDDLPDEGAGQFVDTVYELRRMNPDIKIELLIPDLSGRPDLIQRVVDAQPDVLGHNIEMVPRLFPRIRPQARYERSLNVLRMIKTTPSHLFVKSGFMVGLGETDDEVYALMNDLRKAGCDMLTIGQYLAPSREERHVAVDRFVHPDVFDEYRVRALAMGFGHVLSGPLVRSSYIAESGYQQCLDNIETA